MEERSGGVRSTKFCCFDPEFHIYNEIMTEVFIFNLIEG